MFFDLGAEAKHLAHRDDLVGAVRDFQAHGVGSHVNNPDRHGAMVTMPHDGAPLSGRAPGAWPGRADA